MRQGLWGVTSELMLDAQQHVAFVGWPTMFALSWRPSPTPKNVGAGSGVPSRQISLARRCPGPTAVGCAQALPQVGPWRAWPKSARWIHWGRRNQQARRGL